MGLHPPASCRLDGAGARCQGWPKATPVRGLGLDPGPRALSRCGGARGEGRGPLGVRRGRGQRVVARRVVEADMRGLVTCSTVCSAGALRGSKDERDRIPFREKGVGRFIAPGRVAPRAAVPRLLDPHGRLVGGESSGSTARDPHQPASSRATATLAITGRFLRRFKLTQRSCSRWLPACPPVPPGLVPAALQHHTGPVGGAVMPGGLDQQSPHVRVAGLGDRALRPGSARRSVRWAPARDRRRCSRR